MAWIQLTLVPLLALTGIYLGHRIGRTRRWWLGFLIPLALVILVLLGRRFTSLFFTPPMSWVNDADYNPLLMTLAATLMLSTLIIRLPPHPRRRIAPRLMMGIMILYYGILPALMPLSARAALAATPTRINSQGICLQAHGYTCGPASAVTCLKSLGILAGEGALAIESRCGPVVGADGHLLAAAITRLYADRGITARYQPFNTPEEIPLPAIANMTMPGIGGHYIALLEVHPDTLTIGDPLSGRYQMPREEFLRNWQRSAITFTHTPTPASPASSR